MPWVPELFSAPVLDRIQREASLPEASTIVPYFSGVMSGDTDALVRSFAGEPELHHPVRGRIKGRRAFERFVADTSAWLAACHAIVDRVDLVLTPGRGVEEAVVSLDHDGQRVTLPVAVATDRGDGARIRELRLYYSSWPLTGRHANRPPLLQPDPDIRESDVIGEYQQALAAGDAEAAVAAFEPDAHVREPAGGSHVHRGRDELRALYERLFSNGGGIPLEHCSVTDDGRACAVEYNVVRWGRTELAPEAGVAVYVRGASGRLASARIYDDADPPLAARG